MPAPKHSGRLELTWTNKRLRLLANRNEGYEWVPPHDYRVSEVRLLRDAALVGRTRSSDSRSSGNLLIRGDALNALVSLSELPEFASEYVGRVRLAYIDPPFTPDPAIRGVSGGWFGGSTPTGPKRDARVGGSGPM